jgi:hypothetical protein
MTKEEMKELRGMEAIRMASIRGYVLTVEYKRCDLIVNPKIAEEIIRYHESNKTECPTIRISMEGS